MSKTKKIILFLLALSSALSLSQLSSYLINESLAIGETLKLNGLIHLTHIRNHGGIFGSFDGQGHIVALFSSLLLLGLSTYIIRAKDIKVYEYLCYGLIVGAGSSNILDRLIYGSVIDYINIQHIPYWHYIFNTADTFIHIGVWPLIFLTFFLEKKDKAQ